MKSRKLSLDSLKSRIDTLRRRHREIDQRITRAENRPSVDMLEIKQLKQERLGLRDAIRMTQTIAARLNSSRIQTGGHTPMQTG